MGWITKRDGKTCASKAEVMETILYNDREVDKTLPCLSDKGQLSVQWLGYLVRVDLLAVDR